MSTGVSARGANVVLVPPPVFYGLSFAAGMGLHALTGDAVAGRPATAWLGAALMACGLTLILGAIAMFIRAHTTIVPHHEVAHLVTTSVYRFSRNPMYAGLALVCVGGALAVGTWWPLLTLIPALVVVREFVIAPEEAYLRQAFGEEYARYARTVRRWL